VEGRAREEEEEEEEEEAYQAMYMDPPRTSKVRWATRND
jgi:hypothetical protein